MLLLLAGGRSADIQSGSLDSNLTLKLNPNPNTKPLSNTSTNLNLLGASAAHPDFTIGRSQYRYMANAHKM